MKKLYFLLCLISGLASAQIVNIPDANLKLRLLEADVTNSIAKDNAGNSIKIDVNSDNEIQQSEALLVYRLMNLNYSSAFPIYDYTGLQSFTNLSELYLGYGNDPTLDLSNLSNLTILFCNNSNLTSLNISGCTALVQLVCENNQLTSLDLSGTTNLTSVYADNNQLQSINLQGLSNLSTLAVGNNLLTTLDVTPCVNLYSLYATMNQLTSVNLNGLTQLNNAYFNYNNLTVLDVSTLTSLQYLQCSFNNLTTLDVSNCPNFISLACTDNDLVTLFMKFGNPSLSISGGYPLTNNPNLQYVCMDDFRIPGFLQYFNDNGMTGVHVNSYCTYTPGGNHNTISGTLTVDNDNNGCDTNDDFNPYIRLDITGGLSSGATFTNDAGQYAFYTLAGNFTVSPSLENPTWFNVSPNNANANFPDVNNNSATQDFCITPNGIHPDLEIVIAPVTSARPGFDAIYKIVYRNKGNQTLSQAYGINFFYDDNLMDLVSTSVVPNTSGTGSLSWDYANLRPFDSREIIVTFNINAPTDANPVNINDILTFTASILPQAGDENTTDNLFVFRDLVSGSYDPNDITCLEGEVVAPSEIGDYLHYMIRFENTGTAEAENIVVRTEINPTDFDINSMQLINASHPVYTRVNGNVVEFIFEQILLESGGHGNVLLKLQSLNTLQQGDNVNKRADIYFDYNYPVATNEAETTFQALSNPDFEQDQSISVYPNPTKGKVNVSGDFTLQSVQLYDVQGRLLQTQLADDNQTIVDISAHSNGVYFIKVTSNKGIKVGKIVKE